jgi:hypothetical protein
MTTATAAEDAMRLDAHPSHCPECDYALDGLPSAGKCPECGHTYDSNCLIFRGYQAGRSANYATGTRKRMVWSLSVWTAFFAFTFGGLFSATTRSRSATDWLLNAGFVVVMLWTVVSLTWRRATLDGPPCQLWLCREGYWLRDRTSMPAKPAKRRLGWIVGWLISLTILGVVIYTSPMVVIVMVGLFAAMVALVLRFARAKPMPVSTRIVGDTKTAFHAWEPTTKTFVERKSPGLYQVTITPEVGSFWKLDVRQPQTFVTEMTDVEAESLRSRFFEWVQTANTVPAQQDVRHV